MLYIIWTKHDLKLWWEELFFMMCWGEVGAVSTNCENFTKSVSHGWVPMKTHLFVPVIMRCSSFSQSAWCLTWQTNDHVKNPHNDWLVSLCWHLKMKAWKQEMHMEIIENHLAHQWHLPKVHSWENRGSRTWGRSLIHQSLKERNW